MNESESDSFHPSTGRKGKARALQVSSESESDSFHPSTGRKGKAPTRCTLYRRKKRAEKDKNILSEAGGSEEGAVCRMCGELRHLSTGHAHYKGEFHCFAADGRDGQTPQEWLSMQIEDVRVPRTTMWRMMKADARPEEAKAKNKPRKVPKLRTCQRCGHPAMKEFGHSQMNLRHGKVFFCAMQDGISLDLWQARHRAREEVCLSICLFSFLCLLPLTVSRYSEGNAGGEEDGAEGQKDEGPKKRKRRRQRGGRREGREG